MMSTTDTKIQIIKAVDDGATNDGMMVGGDTIIYRIIMKKDIISTEGG